MNIDYDKLSSDVVAILKREFSEEIPEFGIAAGGAVDSAVREALGLITPDMPTRYKDLDVYYILADPGTELVGKYEGLTTRSWNLLCEEGAPDKIRLLGSSGTRSARTLPKPLNGEPSMSSYLEHGFASFIKRGYTQIHTVDNCPANTMVNRVWVSYVGSPYEVEYDLISGFDINCTQAAINLETQEVVLHKNYINYLYSKELKINPDQPTPVALSYRLLEKHEQFPGTKLDFDKEMHKALSARALLNYAVGYDDKSVLGGAIGEVNLSRMLKHKDQILSKWYFEKNVKYSSIEQAFYDHIIAKQTPTDKYLRRAYEEIRGLNTAGNAREIYRFLKEGYTPSVIDTFGYNRPTEENQQSGYFISEFARELLTTPELAKKCVIFGELFYLRRDSYVHKAGIIDAKSVEIKSSDEINKILSEFASSFKHSRSEQMSLLNEYQSLFSTGKKPSLSLINKTRDNQIDDISHDDCDFMLNLIDDYNSLFNRNLSFNDIYKEEFCFYKGFPVEPDMEIINLYERAGLRCFHENNVAAIFHPLYRAAHPISKADKRIREGLERLIERSLSFSENNVFEPGEGPYQYLIAMQLLSDNLDASSLTDSFYKRFETQFARHPLLFNSLLQYPDMVDLKGFSNLIKTVSYFERREMQEVIGTLESGEIPIEFILSASPDAVLDTHNKIMIKNYEDNHVDPLFTDFSDAGIDGKQVSSANTLTDIGRDLRHCVGGYWGVVKSYQTFIFDIKDKKRETKQDRSTLELRLELDRNGNPKFRKIQHYTFCNKQPKTSHVAFASKLESNLIHEFKSNYDSIIEKISDKNPYFLKPDRPDNGFDRMNF